MDHTTWSKPVVVITADAPHLSACLTLTSNSERCVATTATGAWLRSADTRSQMPFSTEVFSGDRDLNCSSVHPTAWFLECHAQRSACHQQTKQIHLFHVQTAGQPGPCLLRHNVIKSGFRACKAVVWWVHSCICRSSHAGCPSQGHGSVVPFKTWDPK